MKKILSVALALLMLLPGFCYPQPVHAAEEETVSYLIPGKIEWWFDKTRKSYWMDVVQDGLTRRLNIGNPPHPFIDAEFPSALVPGVADESKYEVKSVTIAQDSDIPNLRYSGKDPISDIFDYKLPNATLANADAIIGQSGTMVSFKSRFQAPNISESYVYSYQTANGVFAYRVYVPYKVTFRVIPLKAATISVSGVVDPNPSELTADGYAYPQLTVTGKVQGLAPGESITTWKLEQRPETDVDWLSSSDAGPDLTKSSSWGLKINKDTKIYIRATATTNKGQVLTATGEVMAYVTSGVGDLTARVYYIPIPPTVTITQQDYNANKPVQIQLEADSSLSTATNGIASRLYYWRTGNSGYAYSGWNNQAVYKTTTWINPKDDGGTREIPILGRVAIRDNKGFVAYATDAVTVQLQVVASPPETVLSGPEYLLPRELGEPNTFTWTYNSPDGIPYDRSLLTVEKQGSGGSFMPVVMDQEQADRNFDLQGDEYEVFRIKVKVVDANGNVSDPSTLIREVVSARPAITLKATENGDKIDVAVTDKTVQTVKDLFPTRYTTWLVQDYRGAAIDSGAGQIPAQFDYDTRFQGGAVTFVQHADNALGKTAKAKDTLMFNSSLDFNVLPSMLYEGQFAKFEDLSRYILDKVISIKTVSESDAQFAPLPLTPESTFTRDAGVYNVKLAGKGYLSEMHSIWQYAADRSALQGNVDPATPSVEIVKTFAGDEALYAAGSARFVGNTQSGAFYSGGVEYPYRRQVDYAATSALGMQEIKNVTFKNGTPVCVATIDGNKQYRAITVDLTPSESATEAGLQAAYPIRYDLTDTYVDVTYLKDGQPDRAMNDKILGSGRQIVNGTVRFVGDRRLAIRFDAPGTVEFRCVVSNGLKSSAEYVHQRVITEDTPPKVTVSLMNDVNYRNPENGLKTLFHVTVDQASLDGDSVDLAKAVLRVAFDKNNDGNYTNDGPDSTMTVMRDTTSLQPYITCSARSFSPDKVTASFVLDNPTKNVLGRFRITYLATDAPGTPYLNVPPADLPVVQNNPEDSAAVFLSDNRVPVVELKLTKAVSATITIIDTPGAEPYDIPYLLEQAKLRGIKLSIQHIDEREVEMWYYNWK